MWKDLHSMSFRETGKFSRLFCDYAENRQELQEFHSGFPDREHFSGLIRERSQFSAQQRELLYKALLQDKLHPHQKSNLEKLRQDNCYSVSCGHQLCIAGGPQYMAFKILSTIRLAEELKRMFPDQDFVPVFWMAGEDHDLEEILSFHFFQQACKIQLEGSGPVGRLLCGNIKEQLSAIRDFPMPMAEAYQPDLTLSEATRNWLNYYFGEKGLLILDPDKKELKASFLSVMLQELKSNQLHQEISLQTEKLEKLGYEAQLHTRELNLFFLDKHNRERLVRNGNSISTADGKKSWTLEEAQVFFSENPDCLSPNAALRPLYSQYLLPDVAFIGGPAEIAYWLQLKTTFELHQLPFPLLIPRFSGLLLPANRISRMEKLSLSAEDLFEDAALLRRKLALGETEISLPELRPVFSDMLKLAASQDASLVPALEAEISRMETMAEGMGKRIRKAAEKKAETQLRQLDNLLEFCFPGGSLLERTESWLSLITRNPESLNEISALISPLDFRFQVLQETD